MSVLTLGVYSINRNNKPYIQAIMKYNQKSMIKEIREAHGELLTLDSSPEQNTLANLEKLMNQVQSTSNKIIVTYEAKNSSTLSGVFHPITSIEKQELPFNQAASAYLDALIQNIVSDQNNPLPLAPTTLTKDEARSLVEQYNGSGAIQLNAIKTLIFEFQDACFYLTFGKPCKIGQMGIVFDLDEGFVFQSSNRRDPHSTLIVNTLQLYFKRWKDEQGYEGPVFPESLALNLSQTPTTLDEIPKRRNFMRYLTFPQLSSLNKSNADEYIVLKIYAREQVNFKQIDLKIEQEESWQQKIPTQTLQTIIKVPEDSAYEISRRLKAQDQIIFVEILNKTERLCEQADSVNMGM